MFKGLMRSNGTAELHALLQHMYECFMKNELLNTCFCTLVLNGVTTFGGPFDPLEHLRRGK